MSMVDQPKHIMFIMSTHFWPIIKCTGFLTLYRAISLCHDPISALKFSNFPMKNIARDYLDQLDITNSFEVYQV